MRLDGIINLLRDRHDASMEAKGEDKGDLMMNGVPYYDGIAADDH